MAFITEEALTLDDVLADTPSAALERLGFPGHSDKTARAILDIADRLAPWGVGIGDILSDSRLYRYALDNDR